MLLSIYFKNSIKKKLKCFKIYATLAMNYIDNHIIIQGCLSIRVIVLESASHFLTILASMIFVRMRY